MSLAEGTVLARAKRESWTHQIQTAKRDAAPPVVSANITPMASAAVSMQQRGECHVARIARVTERVLPHLEEMQPAATLDGIHEIENYDRMARRNYGMSDGQQTNGSLQLNILTNQALVQITP